MPMPPRSGKVDLAEQIEAIIAAGDQASGGPTSSPRLARSGRVRCRCAAEAAVDEYNAKCAAGKDDLYGKDAQYLIAIQQGPFYIAKIHEAIEGPLGGVKTNRKFQPVLTDGGVLDNVWVIGLDGIMLYRDVYPIDVPGSASAERINGRSLGSQPGPRTRAGLSTLKRHPDLPSPSGPSDSPPLARAGYS